MSAQEGPEQLRVGVDIGIKNLCLCGLRGDGSVSRIALVDLAGGRYAQFCASSPDGAEESFRGAGGSRATIHAYTEALVRFLDAWGVQAVSYTIEMQLGMHNIKSKCLSVAIQTYALKSGCAVTFERPYGATLGKKTTYAERKRAAIAEAERRMGQNGDAAAAAWAARQAKRDDIADAYLMACKSLEGGAYMHRTA